jgi:serine/threonine protein kinase
VKRLLARFRQLPLEQQKQVPALLNGLGKLQFGSQDFEGAKQTFTAVAQAITEATAQAEALFNAFRAALEGKRWDDALAAIQQAAMLDAQRFAPFPLQRYQPKKILGAGGFGTAFLCHDRNFDEEVVVKTLHDGAMERNMTDVFREARLLRKLNHPAIIGVHECEFADPLKQSRPYIVMDYFPGGSLQNFVQVRGAISADEIISVARQIAQGMLAAHQSIILHRELKPDNVLIRKEGGQWKVKIIDFGLALRKQTIETSMAAGAAGNTILGDSVAGTIEYAPPEQMGKLKGVKPGPYSDVYAFGKMCCYALFKTTEPKNRHWATISKELAGMLEQCTEQELEHPASSFRPWRQRASRWRRSARCSRWWRW